MVKVTFWHKKASYSTINEGRLTALNLVDLEASAVFVYSN